LNEITLAISTRKFSALILDAPWFPELTERYYVRQRRIFSQGDVCWTKTGMKTIPQIIYVPRKE
jgi:hypothetical protein